MTSPIDKLREALDKLQITISGGLCYVSAEAKHAQLKDAQKELKEALKFLDTLTPSEAWQPIETETEFDVVRMVWWKDGCWWAFRSKEKYADGKYVWFAKFGGSHQPCNPTHWQPLPPPPEKTQPITK